MRILYVSQLGGGHDSYVKRMALALTGLGHDVTIAYLSFARSPLEESREGGVRIVKAGLPGIHYYFGKLPVLGRRLSKLIRVWEYMRVLNRLVMAENSRNGCDILELHEILFKRSVTKYVPVVVRMHSLDWIWRIYADSVDISNISALDILAEKILLGSATAVCSPSRALIKIIEETCGLNVSATVMSLPVDTSTWYPAFNPVDSPVILFVGRVERRKGADAILRSMKEVWACIPDAELHMIGAHSPELAEMINRMEDPRIKLIGKVNLERLPEYYRSAMLLVAPSRWDNSPTVIYEAMSSGLPVVATKVGGVPELVRDSVTGFLVDVDDDAELARRIIMLLSDKELRTRMGRVAREIAVSEYDINIIARKTLTHYMEVIEKWRSCKTPSRSIVVE